MAFASTHFLGGLPTTHGLWQPAGLVALFWLTWFSHTNSLRKQPSARRGGCFHRLRYLSRDKFFVNTVVLPMVWLLQFDYHLRSAPARCLTQAFSVNAFRWRIRDERTGDWKTRSAHVTRYPQTAQKRGLGTRQDHLITKRESDNLVSRQTQPGIRS